MAVKLPCHECGMAVNMGKIVIPRRPQCDSSLSRKNWPNDAECGYDIEVQNGIRYDSICRFNRSRENSQRATAARGYYHVSVSFNKDSYQRSSYHVKTLSTEILPTFSIVSQYD